jgi:hypothetical protein
MSDVFRDKDLAPVFDTKAFMLAHTWRCLSDTPAKEKNVLFDKFLTSHQMICDLASTIDLKFADVQEILQSPMHPTSADLEALPAGPTTGWIGYILTLHKRGYRKRHYGGSGTDGTDAGKRRFYNYDHHLMLPAYVAEAIEDGFVITHKGVFCWTESIPPPALQPLARLLFVAVEAAMSYTFWVIRTPNGGDFGMAHLCLWDRLLLDYEGLCSHCALFDGVRGNFDLSAAQLEELTAQRQTLRAERRAITKRQARAEVKANACFVCTLCNTTCSDQNGLDRHKQSPKHLRKEAGENLENFRFKCYPCVYGTDHKKNFRDHTNSDRHDRMCAAQEAQAIKDYDTAVFEAYEFAKAEARFDAGTHHGDMGIEEFDLYRE